EKSQLSRVYGSIDGIPEGTSEISGRLWLASDEHQRQMMLRTSVSRVIAPSQSGFGANVIRDLIPFELGGVVKLSLLPKVRDVGWTYPENGSANTSGQPRRTQYAMPHRPHYPT